MKVKFVEATNHPEGFNWGKFMLGRFERHEWEYRSALVPVDELVPMGELLLHGRGWDHTNILVLDLETREGAVFRPGGLASADLHKHQVWVCPMFEPFLEWLYKQDLTDLDALPALVKLDAPSALRGYRRDGSGQAQA